jgi:hypothetical protein
VQVFDQSRTSFFFELYRISYFLMRPLEERFCDFTLLRFSHGINRAGHRATKSEE